VVWRCSNRPLKPSGLSMAEVIQFPRRGEIQTVRFNEKHVFGEVGGLRLSLVQEEGKDHSPLVLVLLGGTSGVQLLETFDPSSEGMESAKVVGDIALRALATAHESWTGKPVS
jgi:hypothetical protein